MNSPQTFVDLEPGDTVETPAVCDSHGPYTAKTFRVFRDSAPVTIGCPACAEERKAADDARRAEIERREMQARKQRRIDQLIGHSCIPPRFADKSFDNYTPANPASRVALTAARKYAEAFVAQSRQGRSLVFAGGPGTGKTHLATAIGQHVIREFQAVVLFGTVSQALRRIKDTYRKDSEKTESDVIRAMTDCDLLILDEIGAQIGSEHEKQLMFEILNERYQGMKSTILISNLNAEELEGFLGHRVMDRYRECGVVLAFGWESHRGKQKPHSSENNGGCNEDEA